MAAPESMADYGHTEPGRGAEWWGKSPLVTLGLFSKVTRRQGGTNSRRYRSNGYVLGLIQDPGRPEGRHREQAPSHRVQWRTRSWVDSHADHGLDFAFANSLNTSINQQVERSI